VRNAGDMATVMLSIMRNKRASTRVVELAAEVIAADARFNGKVGDEKEKPQSGERIFHAVDFAEQTMNECQQLNVRFCNGLSISELCDELERIRIKIDSFVFS